MYAIPRCGNIGPRCLKFLFEERRGTVFTYEVYQNTPRVATKFNRRWKWNYIGLSLVN